MEDLELFFRLGWKHIISSGALDHILFIVALTASYSVKDWKTLLILVTAFTIGHSLTLALSVYDLIRFNNKLVEILVPCTIIIASILNFSRTGQSKAALKQNYLLALFFGLVHGMGFANTIRFMLAKNQDIALPLLGFNIGLEAGQVTIVAIILLLAFLVVELVKVSSRLWALVLSLVAFSFAIKMIIERV